MKGFFSKPLMYSLSVVVAFAAIGVGYACYNPPPPPPCTTDNTGFSWAVSNDDGHTTNAGGFYPIDKGDDNKAATQYDKWGGASSNDPTAWENPGACISQQVKDVAKTTACIQTDCKQTTSDDIYVTVCNGYPQYSPTVFFGVDNNQCYDVKIDSITINNPHPEAITVTYAGISVGQTITPCKEGLGQLDIKVLQPAVQNSTYCFTVSICLTQPPCPGITLDKTACPTSVCAPGNVSYTYKITNTGNVALSGLKLTDDHITGNITLSATSLAPGASTTAKATYAITQLMINAGTPIVNTATVTGTPPTGSNVTATDKATVTICQNPKICVDKTVSPTSVSAAGNVTYTFKVTNTGNVPLTSVTLYDSLMQRYITLPVTSLAPGASTTVTASYMITQTMINAGTCIINTATATGKPPTGSNVTATDKATVTINKPPTTTCTTKPPTTTCTTKPPTTTCTTKPPTTTCK